MKSIRIGNDIRIEWPIVLSGDVSKLQDLDLTVEVRPSMRIIDAHNYADTTDDEGTDKDDKKEDKQSFFEKTEMTVMMNGGIECRPDIGDGKEHCRPRPPRPCPPRPHKPLPPAPVKLPYHIEDNTLIAMWTADRQFATGDYDIILYAHKNEGGQAVCDQYRFVRLVSHSAQADAPDDSGIEAVIAMQPVTLELSGLSAYEVAVINGFTGTEEEWLASLKQPAVDAAEQAKKDLEKFKTDTKAEIMEDITELQNTVWPLEVTMTADKTLLEYTGKSQDVTLSWNIKRKGKTIIPDSLELTLNGKPTINIGSTETTKTVSTAEKTAVFMLKATYKELTKSATITVAQVLPMYFGFNAALSAGSLTITDLTKQAVKASPAGTYTLANGADGEYMWLCVPEDMSISKVTLNGFDVPMEAAQALATPYGNYNCYRSSNDLVKGIYTIQIEGKGIAVQPSQPGGSGSTVIVQVDELSEDNLLDIINKNNNLE